MLAAETGRKRVVLKLPQRGRELASRHGSGPPGRGVRSGCGRNAVVELVVKHLPTGNRRTRTSSAPCDDTGALHSQALRRPARLQPSFVHPVHPPSSSLTLQQRQPGQFSAFNHILRCSEILSFQAGCGIHRRNPSSFSRTDIPRDVHSTPSPSPQTRTRPCPAKKYYLPLAMAVAMATHSTANEAPSTSIIFIPTEVLKTR